MSDELSAPLEDLKPREIEILQMMANGLTNREIAEQLFITKETVRWYNKQIYSKLGTSRRTKAVALARKFGLLAPAAPQAAPATAPVQPHLPVTNGPFIGREDALADLAELLTQGPVRLVSLVAAGGMGKSRLALEVAHHLKDDFENGAAFIDLTTIDHHTDIVTAALASLKIPASGQIPPRGLLLNYCQQKKMLLIFDNMEHVMAGAGLLAELLEATPHIKILATSRERLNLRVETVYYLGPVTQGADHLFIKTAQMMHSHLAFTEDDLPAVDRIVELVGGMPLALVLAATWADVLPVAEIAEEIERSLAFLSSDLADMPPRQRSVYAILDPTWEQLNDEERKAFMWAAVFRNGFTRHTFQQMTGASIRVLQKLLGRSLVVAGYQHGYDMHPLLRQYAHEKMEAMGVLEDAHADHLNTFLTLAEQQMDIMFGGDNYLRALEALENEVDNFRAALDWAIKGGRDIERGTCLAVTLFELWEARSHAYEAEAYLTAALDQDPPPRLRGVALRCRSRFQYRLGQMAEAAEDARAAIAIAEELGDDYSLVESLRNLVNTLAPAEQLPLLQRALEVAESVQGPHLLAKVYNILGNYYSMLGDYSEALAHYEQSERLYGQVGDLRGVSMVVYNAGITHAAMGDQQQARRAYESSLELKRAIGDRAGIARRLAVIAEQMILEEEMESAAANLAESTRICEALGNSRRLTYTRMLAAIIHYMSTDFQQAETILLEILPLAERLNLPSRLASIQHLLVFVYLAEGRVAPAKHVLGALVTGALAVQIPYGLWVGLSAGTAYLLAVGNVPAAIPALAVAAHHQDVASAVDRLYFLNPLVYQVQQSTGADTWDAAYHEPTGQPLDAALQAVAAVL